MKRLREGS